MSPVFILNCTILLFSVTSAIGISEGVFDKIKAGLQKGLQDAKNYLETARDIADLVSKSLRPKQADKRRGDEEDFTDDKKTEKPFQPTKLMSTFFHLLGLDTSKVSAVAVNSFIFLAQMISELYNLKPKVDQAEKFEHDNDLPDPIRLITGSQNEKVQHLLEQAKDKDLPKQLIEFADRYDSSCVKLLLCKISPIIWAAQESLKNGAPKRRFDMISWLPTKDKVEEYSDDCEDKHKDCKLNFSH